MKLDHHDIAILRDLDEAAAYTVAGILVEIVPWSRRSNSQILTRRLKALELAGFVGRLDSQKPIAWTRTPAGTACLAEAVA